MNQFIRKVNMTDKTKYKSVAIDNDCYKKIEELSTSPTHAEHKQYGLKPWNTFKSAVKRPMSF